MQFDYMKNGNMRDIISKILTVINGIFFAFALFTFIMLWTPQEYPINNIPSLFDFFAVIFSPIFFILYIVAAIVAKGRLRKLNICFLVVNIVLFPLFYFALEIAMG